MKFVESFFGNGGSFGSVHCHGRFEHSHAAYRSHMWRLDFIHITRQQFYFRIIKGFAAVVVHRNPADEVAVIAFLWRDKIVARAPIESAGDVADFRIEAAGLVGLQQPVESRLENRVAAEIRKKRFARQRKL